MNQALVLHCPACAAGYLLPRNLLGPLGARVTCPACRESFDVGAGGEPAAAMANTAGSRAPARPSGAGSDEPALARAVLDDLADRLGDELAAAARENRLFRDHGRELLDAFDDFRQRAGRKADARTFREELQRRWHLDLFPFSGARG